MKRLFILVPILLALGLTIVAQNTNKVAILEIVDKNDNVDYGVKLQLRAFLTYAINRTPGYEGYDRVDVSSIIGEHNFQRTGLVSDSQIKKLGEMTGANSILVAEAARYGADANRIIITVKIINVETALIQNSSRPKTASTDDVAMEKACTELAAELLGNGGGNGYSVQQSSNMIITVDNVSFTMIYVKGGNYVMGCTEEQGDDCLDNCEFDCQTYDVTVSDFYIGETEVTQALWRAVMGGEPTNDGGWTTKFGRGDDYPAYSVGGDDVNVFLERLTNKTGLKFRFSTYEEWEYAARGGNKSKRYKYSGSNDINEVAWFKGNSNNKTHPVKMKKPNELGIYDMTGNVYELNEFGFNYGLAFTSRGGCFRSDTNETIVTGFWPIGSIGYEDADGVYIIEGPESDRLCGLRLVLDKN